MIIVIQCAAGKQDHAGHLRTLDGLEVMFVAHPDSAPSYPNRVYARPDDLSDRGTSWRNVLQEYNRNPGENPLELLSAWQLYKNPVYELLAERFTSDSLYILSAGWGLIRADYLTPNYDITFSKAPNVEPYKRRDHRERYEDFSLPPKIAEPMLFFGGRDYLSLFCRLTESIECSRTVFYAGRKANAPGCILRDFGKPFTNWHYKCAKDFLNRQLDHNSDQP